MSHFMRHFQMIRIAEKFDTGRKKYTNVLPLQRLRVSRTQREATNVASLYNRENKMNAARMNVRWTSHKGNSSQDISSF
jgi:hypothetical protein